MVLIKDIISKLNSIIPIDVCGNDSIEIQGITHDSRSVKPGYIFAVLQGEAVDGAKFIKDAIAKGAVALLTSSKDKAVCFDIPNIVVEDVRMAMGQVAAVCFDNPTKNMKLVGITGTNGKTTVSYMVEAVSNYCDQQCGVMGTIEYRVGSKSWPATHTTPESPVVQEIAHDMIKMGAKNLVMEVSSHGLSLGRLNGCEFDVVAFTNLSQDHLDFHGTMADYGEAKMKLFVDAIKDNPNAKIVLNLDDEFSNEIIKRATHNALTFSCDKNSNAHMKPIGDPVYSIDGISVELTTPFGEVLLRSPFIGVHNLSNLLTTIGIGYSLGLNMKKVVESIAKFGAVPGRLEKIQGSKGYSVFVDYAHTPDALERVIFAVKELTANRVICLFGCGGDRDASKRPLMGKAVSMNADVAIVTSDNPRTEDPVQIINMTIPGLEEGGMSLADDSELSKCVNKYVAITDRKDAIYKAISIAEPGDTILVAGKGHEDYVIIGTEKLHFDDREQAAAAIKNREGR